MEDGALIWRSVSLEDARRVVAAALAEGRSRSVGVAAAVVGAHGELIAVARLDDARHYYPDLAYGKAIAAAICDEPSRIAGGAPSASPQPRIGVSSVQERAGAIYGQRVVWAAGAVPLHRGGAMVGAVGVAGPEPDIDEEIAVVAARAL
jgi:uncharacterized protein GlcG (DUF336 family)